MESDENLSLEERAKSFLKSASTGRKSFSEIFEGTDNDVKEFLLAMGYISEKNITALGRTYAVYKN